MVRVLLKASLGSTAKEVDEDNEPGIAGDEFGLNTWLLTERSIWLETRYSVFRRMNDNVRL